MESVADHPAEVNHRERIWFFPDKFWQATKDMPPEQVSTLMEEVERYAAAGDVQALKKYPFVFVGDPYKKSKPAPLPDTRGLLQEPAATRPVARATRDEVAGLVSSGRILIASPLVASSKYLARASRSAAGLISSRPCP